MIMSDKKCFFCGSADNLQEHHCVGGNANRKIADKYGLTIWLCVYHHTVGKKSVHQDYSMNLQVKQYAQRYFEEHIGNRELWMKEFGKNYLD